jgi:hypothetical protein
MLTSALSIQGFFRPLKHRVYSRKPRINLMTLIAGFRHSSGVLLCSDTQMEGATIKTRGPKICTGEFPVGRVAFAFAGNARNAQAAIDACSRRLRAIQPGEDVFSKVEQVLEIQYRRLVYHPDVRDDNDSLHYCLLLSIWLRDRNRTFLWASDDVVLFEPTSDHICFGSGFEIGRYVTDPVFNRDMSEEETLFLAAYMMARVSDNAQGIGGMSHYISIHHDGSQSPIIGVELNETLKERAKGWDAVAARLLINSAVQDRAKALAALQDFTIMHQDASVFWRLVTSDPTISQYLQSTKASASHPPPSPESPGGTDES